MNRHNPNERFADPAMGGVRVVPGNYARTESAPYAPGGYSEEGAAAS